MKRRCKRIAFTVAATGLAVLLVLGIVHREAVRDHVEAWQFQLTRETETIVPGPPLRDPPLWDLKDWLVLLTMASGRRAIFCPAQEVNSGLPWVFSFPRNQCPAKAVLDVLRTHGWRVLEQRLPHRAHIVIRDEHFDEAMRALTELGGYPLHPGRAVPALSEPSREPLPLRR